MLTQEQNERITRVGPGTPMGNLLRRYWHPVAAAVELDENPVKKVRILGEDLVLYRDKSGNLGLIDEPCPHRRVSLEYGIPEEEGLRCPYHGWVFNHEGRCLEQPAEPWHSTFKDRITTKAYRAQSYAGLVWAYLGPEPAPLIPRYDVFAWDNAIRQIGATVIPCNWVQCMENSLDPVHTEWLHAYYTGYLFERKGQQVDLAGLTGRRHKKIGFDRFEHGIIKRRVYEGFTEEELGWKVGHPIVFPYTLRVGRIGSYSFEMRVPMDDTHTYHVVYNCWRPGIPVPPQESIPYYEIPLHNEQGKVDVDYILGQDFMAWISQGEIARRDLEHLGQSDVGVIMYREMLREQVEKVERGEEPMEVYREPHDPILLPMEGIYFGVVLAPRQIELDYGKFSPLAEKVIPLYEEAAARISKGEPLVAHVEPPTYPVGGEAHREVQILQER